MVDDWRACFRHKLARARASRKRDSADSGVREREVAKGRLERMWRSRRWRGWSWSKELEWLRRGHRAVMIEAVVGFLCREEPLWLREKEPRRDMKRRALCQTSIRHSLGISLRTLRLVVAAVGLVLLPLQKVRDFQHYPSLPTPADWLPHLLRRRQASRLPLRCWNLELLTETSRAKLDRPAR